MSLKSLRILIVDDDTEQTQDLMALLQQVGPERLTGDSWQGLDITHVTNQSDADEAVAKTQFHIVLLDLLYPKAVDPDIVLPLDLEIGPRDDHGEAIFQGILWLPELRRQQKTAAIIVLTSYAHEHDLGLVVETIRNRYADEFVPKTASFYTIVARIAVAWRCARHDAERLALEAEMPTRMHMRAVRIFAEDVSLVFDRLSSQLTRIAQRIASGDPAAVTAAPEHIRQNLINYRTALHDLLNSLYNDSDSPDRSDLVQILSQLLDLCRGTAERNKVRLFPIASTGQVEVITFVGDLKVAMYEVLTNAINGAAKGSSSKEPSEVEVRLEPENFGAIIRILDNGPGFPHDILDDPFKLHHHLDNHVGKRGMGLYIARRMMHAIGGDIQVQNRPNDSGVEVILTVRNLGNTK